MNNRNRGVVTWLIAVTLIVVFIIVIAQWRENSVRRFPRIEFGELGGPIGKLTFVQRATPQEIPSTVRVYKVKPLASKKNALLRLLRALPIVASPETDGSLRQLERAPESLAHEEKSLSASIGGWTVEVWSGGQFTIYNDELLNRPYDFENPPAAPTPEEAHQTADAFLASIGPLPKDVRFAEVGPGDTLIRGLGNKPGDIMVKSLLVSYSAAIDGIPVYGSVSVRVGAGPAVVSINNRLRQIVPDSMVEILSPQEAFDKLCAGEGHMSDGPSGSATGNVTSIKLVYWQGATARDLSYIMPVYIIEGNAEAPGKKTVPWKAYVEAVRPEFLIERSLPVE